MHLICARGYVYMYGKIYVLGLGLSCHGMPRSAREGYRNKLIGQVVVHINIHTC